MRKPFWKKSHRCWYVRFENRDVKLDPDEATALKLYAEMLDNAKPGSGPRVTFRRLANDYLKENAGRTKQFEHDAQYIGQFSVYIGFREAMSLRAKDVLDWLDGPHPGRLRKDGKRGPDVYWSGHTKHRAGWAVMNVLNWSEREQRIPNNPLRGVRLPTGRARSEVVPPDAHKKMMAAAEAAFQQVLIAAQSGARPGAIRSVTADHVSRDGATWVFEDHKTRHKTNRPLVVYLTPELKKLTKKLVKQHPAGPLFRQSNGRPWGKDTLTQKFRRLRIRLKLPETLTIYNYRHTFATNALLAGHSLATVAQLLGHSDTRMVGAVYGHLEHHRNHLIEAAAKVNTKK